MWTSLIRIQKFFQKLRPLNLIFNEEKCIFCVNPLTKNQLIMRLVDFNLGLVVISSIIGLDGVLSTKPNSNQLNSEQIKTQTQKQVLGSILFILYVTLFIYYLVAAWTFAYRNNDAEFGINTANGLFLDRLKNSDPIPGVPSKRESALFGSLLYIMMLTCIFGWFAVTVFPVASSNNPGYVILSWILPEQMLQERRILIKFLSILYIGVSGYYGVIPIMQAFTYVTAFLFEMKYILRRAYNYDDNFKQRRNPNKFDREWMCYAQNILFVRDVNQFGTCLYPGIMMTAFSINVATTTVCMKFHHELPPVMFLLLLGFDIVVAVATCIVQSFSVVAREESERFHEYWKPRLFSKRAKMQLKACIATPIWLGPFFEMQRSTLLSTVNEVVNMVVSLMIADQ